MATTLWAMASLALAAGDYNGKSLDDYCAAALKKPARSLTEADRGTCRDRYREESSLRDLDLGDVSVDTPKASADRAAGRKEPDAEQTAERQEAQARDSVREAGIEDLDAPAGDGKDKGGKKAKETRVDPSPAEAEPDIEAAAGDEAGDEDEPGDEYEPPSQAQSAAREESIAEDDGDVTPAAPAAGGDSGLTMMDEEDTGKPAKKKSAARSSGGGAGKKKESLGDRLPDDDGGLD